jgi:hypothetical protein
MCGDFWLQQEPIRSTGVLPEFKLRHFSMLLLSLGSKESCPQPGVSLPEKVGALLLAITMGTATMQHMPTQLAG